MNVQIHTKAGGSPKKLKEARKNAKRDAEKFEKMRKSGCSCDMGGIGGWSTDPRCPLHGLSEFRYDPADRR